MMCDDVLFLSDCTNCRTIYLSFEILQYILHQKNVKSILENEGFMLITESHHQTTINNLLESKNQLGSEEMFDGLIPKEDKEKENEIEEGSGDLLEEWDMPLFRQKRDYKALQISNENTNNEDTSYMLVPIARVRIILTHWALLHDVKYFNIEA